MAIKNDQDYYLLVEKGKAVVKALNDIEKTKNCYQAEIADYALKVCDIRHGGISKGIYTLSRYSDDIGLPAKTVQNWVQIYRNVCLKLDLINPTPEEWNKSRKTNEVIKSENTIHNSVGGNKKKKYSMYKENLSKGEIKNIFDNVDRSPSNTCINRQIKATKYTLHVLKTKNLDEVSDTKLNHLMELLDEAGDLINDFLTKKLKNKKAS